MAGELILIVEDNERNLKLVRDLLEVHGISRRPTRARARTASGSRRVAGRR